MRRFLLILFLAFMTLILAAQFGQVKDFAQAIESGNPLWIGLAVMAQAAWQTTQVEEFRAAFTLAGRPSQWRAVAPATLISYFLLIAAPSGGLSTFALFLVDARRRNLSSGATTLGVMLFSIAEYLSLSLWLIAALFFLPHYPRLSALLIAPFTIIFLATGLFVSMFGLGLWSAARLEKTLLWLIGRGNTLARLIFKRELMAEQNLRRRIAQLTPAAGQIRSQPIRVWLQPISAAIAGRLCAMALLGFIAAAFGAQLSIEQLIIGLGAALSITVVSPTPLGVGFTEGALAYTLTFFNISNETAILISLLYRGLTVWLPALYGFIVMQISGLRIAKQQ